LAPSFNLKYKTRLKSLARDKNLAYKPPTVGGKVNNSCMTLTLAEMKATGTLEKIRTALEKSAQTSTKKATSKP
jgi:hypothetical protein